MGKQRTQTTTKVVPLRSPKVLPGALFSGWRRRPERLAAFQKDQYVLPFLMVLTTDILIFWGSVLVAYLSRDAILNSALFSWVYDILNKAFIATPRDFTGYNSLACIVAITGIVVFRGFGLYKFRDGLERQVHIRSLIKAVAVTYLIVMAALHFIYGYDGVRFARGVVVLSFVYVILFACIAHFGLKHLQHHMVKKGIGFARTIVVAAPGNFKDILEKLRQCYGSLFQVTGFVSSNGVKGKILHGVPVLGNVKDIHSILSDRKIDRVIIALPTKSHEDIMAVMSACEEKGLEFRIIPDIFEMIALRMNVSEFNGLPTITLGETPLAGTGWLLKLLMDKTCALLGVLAAGIMFPFVALAIKLDSRGPIFYRQERIGNDDKVFTLYKFRTMYEDAEKDTGPIWAVEDDPRCTPVGRILRKLNLDEFPQFWNVLKGDMSLVGPRPERAYFVDRFKHHIPNYMRRHMVKSGITGWAQVNGLRGDTSIEERTRYDIYYVENWSLFFDIKILLMTLVSRKNAY